MLRQVLSIALALALGYGGFQHFFAPHHRAPPARIAPTVSALIVPSATPVISPPPPPNLCDEIRSGYYASGRPITSHLLEILMQKHRECFGIAPAPAPVPISVPPP